VSKATISLEEVRIYYDKEGKAREVLMSYETFQKIQKLMREQYGNQDYFWTQTWQKRISEAEADIVEGRSKSADANDVAALIDWLDE